MDQQSTSAMPSAVPGEKEVEQTVLEETTAEPGGTENAPTCKESSVGDTNHSSCSADARSEHAAARAESFKDSKSGDTSDNQQSSNTTSDCKETKVTISPAIKEEREATQNTVNEVESSPLQKAGKDELAVAADVPNEIQATNEAKAKALVVPESKEAIPSCDSEAEIKIDSPSEAEVKIESPGEEEIKIDSPCEEEIKIDSPDEAETKIDSRSEEEIKIDSTSEEEMKIDSPSEENIKIDSPSEEEITIDSPGEAEMKIDSPNEAEIKIDSPSETEKPQELSSTVDSVNAEIEVQNSPSSEETNAKDEPIVVGSEELAKEPIGERPKDEIAETIESTTETIEFSLIEYTEEGVEETTVSNATAIEIIVQSTNEEVSASSAVIATVNASSGDKDTSHSDESTEIVDKNEKRVSIDKKEPAEPITEPAKKEERSNEEETRELGESTHSESSNVTNSSPPAPVVPANDSPESEKPATSVASPSTQRSVIQDIFDDWRDENPEDECQQASRSHDSVEMELKILLDDDKPDERNYDGNVKKITEKQFAAGETESKRNSGSTDAKATIAVNQSQSTESKESEKRRESFPARETTTVQAGSRNAEKSNETTTARDRAIRQKPLAPRPGVKVPGSLLSSPIVSKTDVSKVLKERLREQQKEFDAPVKPDIFFVKKITQRLSHKLAAASAAQMPGLVPLSQSAAKADANRALKSAAASEEKKTSSVDKELLAILEGDVDPDWSNLRPPNLVEETKNGPAAATVEHNTPPKLDPLIERELALKQLLELPSSPGKKNAAKKTPVKTTRNKNAKVAKTATPRSATKKDAGLVSAEAKGEETTVETTEKQDFWNSVKPTTQELKADETRSGRKRKPTEKAREHEQNSTKRLKVLKGRGSSGKRSGNESDQSQSNDPPPPVINDETNKSTTEIVAEKPEIPAEIVTTSEKRLNPPADVPTANAEDSRLAESNREVVAKKVIATTVAKRKIPVGQKFARQKMPANKKPALGLKSKFPKGISKKTATKIIGGKTQKQRNTENTGETKPKKKANNEIDRLLQDEGVVNLLYDVEQTGKKRLVPITKTQTKVMDLQKIQRELKIRTKLVRNAVLRLRTSNISTNKVSPRSKRSTSYNSDAPLADKKSSVNEQIKSGQSSVTSPTDFIFPAKIRNAADASIIIRRHSSSSFSSASASPRASIDGPERLSFDGPTNEDSGTHVLRSNKRLHSREEEEKNRNNKKKKPQQQQQTPEPKRNRRKTAEGPETHAKSIDIDAVVAATTGTKNKASAAVLNADFPAATTPRAAKKVDTKKNAKTTKLQAELIDTDETGGVKATTRSNGAGGGKIMPKSKKSLKGKVTFAKGNESFNKTEATEREDELSACLAEVVTALANDSGGPSRSRSTVPVNRYKTKGIASNVKTSETDGSKPKLESRVQFSNKEINVQRHGNLVQLLLTPSKTTKIRNGITLQVMQEIRENLTILKKDEECRVVLLTSTGSSFCEGLELSTILHENKEERRIRAQELANGVKEFIKSLATFNKPIVAGVQGSAIGLGVTMLPWFDLVIASDKATFSTPYGKLGQIAEGAAIFTLSHILGSAVTSELLLGGRTLTASEALRAGLVTRVLWPDRFQAELLPSLRAMSEQSSQSMEATKALLRHSLRKKLDAALESESYLLVQHWCSAECQAAITAYVDEHIQ